MSWSDAVRWRNQQTGPVVFTNGVFDLLHVGHIDLLTAARALGNRLIVALNSDDSVRRLKGPSRPVRSEAERAYVVAALEAVDAVTVFEEDTPREIVLALRPDVLVKGGDYSLDTIIGRAEVESWGGRVHVVPLTPGQSTTRIIEALRAGS
ncbi:MAG TPA: D-glycero-beta-D-manno-heptose 1-phosphate adenylyltransferase [Gemmatimonadaceae bacterium]|nr:D-glycero-beta-D-manno-heptose 1-phosphate adenylyltransferase [Gemmatimonadaceae bacterium]